MGVTLRCGHPRGTPVRTKPRLQRTPSAAQSRQPLGDGSKQFHIVRRTWRLGKEV
jgi:hypothetical protein